MSTSCPLDVAFVWHMHQPYYRSARTGSFEMPWARMHALKDYLDMVQVLEEYPAIHQTFNLVPSLVEQLEDYASGDYEDVYWRHTLKPAAELEPEERAFLLERMCEHTDHPRARSHPRYLELAHKRDAVASLGWEKAALSFSTQELLDLQIWFNLAWFGTSAHTDKALLTLVERGRDFQEEDKSTLAQSQASVLADVIPAYREAVARTQVELTTSPYFHPILPLLCDTDSARIASPALSLPPQRFAHPEDALEQLREGLAKHEGVFGEAPRGVWCSEMAVGEAVIPLLTEVGIQWTISDESVLSRSVSDVTARPSMKRPASFGSPYQAYRVVREGDEMSIVFRDHTLSDLIGFTYRSWGSRDAALDLIARLRDIGHRSPGRRGSRSPRPLVVIALDGENAWEYYPNEGRDFLSYLYEGLSADESLHCVTVSEHLRESPPQSKLEWLHTGSWIFADLTTWCGTDAHNLAWDELHQARDLVQSRRQQTLGPDGHSSVVSSGVDEALEAAWRHVLVAEGSDWFWWYGEHHHTELDSVWDLEFRVRLQEVYRLLGLPMPLSLTTPLSKTVTLVDHTTPSGSVEPQIDGIVTHPGEWSAAGYLLPITSATMHHSSPVHVHEVRFGWQGQRLCLMVALDPASLRVGLWLEIVGRGDGQEERPIVRVTLEEGGSAAVESLLAGLSPDSVEVAWQEVVEIALPSIPGEPGSEGLDGLVVRLGIDKTTAEEFHSSEAIPMNPGLS